MHEGQLVAMVGIGHTTQDLASASVSRPVGRGKKGGETGKRWQA